MKRCLMESTIAGCSIQLSMFKKLPEVSKSNTDPKLRREIENLLDMNQKIILFFK